jgi:hypothetical protein
MKVLLFLTLLAACGQKDLSSDGKKDKDIEVTRVAIDQRKLSISTGDTVSLSITYSTNGDLTETTAWSVVTVLLEGDKPSKDCDKQIPSDAITKIRDINLDTYIDDLKSDEEYALLACSFNPDRGYYGTGLVKVFKTE